MSTGKFFYISLDSANLQPWQNKMCGLLFSALDRSDLFNVECGVVNGISSSLGGTSGLYSSIDSGVIGNGFCSCLISV